MSKQAIRFFSWSLAAVAVLASTPSRAAVGSAGAYRAQVITAPGVVRAGEPTAIEITLTGPDGRPLRSLREVYKQPFAAFLWSRDFREIVLLQPRRTREGTFVAEATLSRRVPYELVIEAQPEGSARAETIRVPIWPEGAQAVGRAPLLAAVHRSEHRLYSAVVGRTRISLLGWEELLSRQERNLTFSVRELASDSPVSDLQEAGGAMGRLVVLSEDGSVLMDLPGRFAHESSPAYSGRGGTYPDAMQGFHAGAAYPQPYDTDVAFTVRFPAPGRYRLFVMVQRGDRTVTAPFAVEVD